MRRFLPSTVFEWIVLVVVIVVAWAFWNGRKDSNDSNDTAILKSNLATTNAEMKQKDSANAVLSSQLTAALSRAPQVVERWHTVKEPVYLPPTSTSHDTIQSFVKRLNACYAGGDSLVATIVEIKTKCEVYRDSAKSEIATGKKAYAQLDSLYSRSRVEKRLQPYGELLYEPLKQRPVIGLGLTSKMFWKLDAKAEAQYAIPRAKPDSTDGLRFVVGAHIRF